jgi:predicted nucleotidyltransferase
MSQELVQKGLVQTLLKAFGERLLTVVLFGSRARGEANQTSDFDVLLVIENLPTKTLERLKQVRRALMDIPERTNAIAKTPEEIDENLTPLLLEVCVDGKCLHGSDYFEPYRQKALAALQESGLKRKRVGREWYWQFERIPKKNWELTWEGFHELP